MVPSEKTSEIKSIPVVRRPEEYKTVDYKSEKEKLSEEEIQKNLSILSDYWKTQEAKNGLGLISSLGIQVPAEILEEVR